jgi:uncharacterized protein (DUF2164 family)
MNAAYAQGCRDNMAQVLERLRAMGRAEVADALQAEWLAAQEAGK